MFGFFPVKQGNVALLCYVLIPIVRGKDIKESFIDYISEYKAIMRMGLVEIYRRNIRSQLLLSIAASEAVSAILSWQNHSTRAFLPRRQMLFLRTVRLP